jgi:uncharacterized membrane protein YjfL (UPF0719 family)
MKTDLFTSLWHTVAYTGVGVFLLVFGFWVLDLVTPGDLRSAVFRFKAIDAGLVAGAHMISMALIIIAAIHSSAEKFSEGIVSTFAHGVVGVVLLALALILVDALTPENFRESLTDNDPTLTGGALLMAAVELAVGAVVAVSIL